MLSFILYSERKSYLICFHCLLQIYLICQKKDVYTLKVFVIVKVYANKSYLPLLIN